MKTEKKNQLKVVPEKYKGALGYQQSLFSGIKFRHKHRKNLQGIIYIYININNNYFWMVGSWVPFTFKISV